MSLLERTLTAIPEPDLAAARETQARLDQKTKPPRSLGRLEDLACALASVRGTADLELPRKAVVIMAGDHGVAEEGVSAFPQEVTAQMVLNFASGGAGINVLARHAGAEVLVVDMGVKAPLPASPAIRSVRVAPGTANIARGPAMSRAQATAALEAGIAVANELADRGLTLLAIGEMGIANTTPASALAAAFTGRAPLEVTGRGTGIGDEAHRHKVEVIARALEVNRPDLADPLGVLAALGGYEIAGLAGVVLGAAARRIPVLTDGFIASVAALSAVRIAPRAGYAVLASHRSVEAGHRHVLAALGKEPLFDLDLRLGEGTGAALAMHLVDASVRILREMATFASAGVSGKA
ncbi:MAG TPA: nicotinate-nucleotide--dimethylbenzimidazole phosphoribosyltransferase [Anaeromyxobacteraceae bacterium]|jgi:nicotinate-nucleotide--dimethylbenzimidazole phosphoribosyltransferase|nr:nicotinate-nucleotide--dimethylbenzimidazole phosphoribosyltransferase [Anaeromyxobacteraceae bacterium]